MLIFGRDVDDDEAAMATVPGIDVSYWQAEVNWPAVRKTGQEFAFIKATEGLGYTDPTFSDNWRGAKATGLLRGAYCLFHPTQDAKQQALRFLGVLKDLNDDGELPCSLDLEVVDGVANQTIVKAARIWLQEVELALGRRPMIYSGVSFLETNFRDPAGGPPSWALEYPLWLGWFPSQFSTGMNPLMPSGWSKWTFWQYGGAGHLDGIKAAVDEDFFNGTLEELHEFAGLSIPPQEPKIHTVVAGDSLESIAIAYSISLSDLVRANPQLLKIGDRLTVPK